MAKKVDVSEVRIKLAGADGRALNATTRRAFQATEEEAEFTGRHPGLDEIEGAPTNDERLTEDGVGGGYNCDN